MANIMLTDACNLKCQYCFANEFVNKDRNEISMENFEKAVSFITADGFCDRIGLIGGEPTLHSQFDKILRTLILNPKVHRIVLYTNGVFLDNYRDLICHPKMALLVNCNSPEEMGITNFERMDANLDYMLNTRLFREKITMGINLYSPDMDIQYMLQLLQKYDMHHVRISITVPNDASEKNSEAVLYFKKMKQFISESISLFLSNGIIPNYDCNKMPACVLPPVDPCKVETGNNTEIIKHLKMSNITHTEVQCHPVVDIRQDLTAVRCFGLSEWTKQNIQDYRSLKELINYYMRTIDSYMYNTVSGRTCADCRLRKVQECSGGCLAFKIDAINKNREFAEKLIDSGLNL